MTKLGLRLRLYRAAKLTVPVDQVRHAESLGYDSVWTAEAYGSDALTPLAYLAAHTERIRLGTAVVQLAARPPATLAMQAMTIDAMAGGNRLILGIGLSGPQIVEGWYGQPWGRPNARLRDYLQIVRKVLAREEPVSHDGSEIRLPYAGLGALGQGKPLKSIMHPVAPVPLWLGAGGPRNVALTAELCDGWLPMGLGPEGVPSAIRDRVAAGGFDVFTGVSVSVTDDVRGALDAMRPLTAMYVGGMGSETHNYHHDAMARRGFPTQAGRIVELWRAGHKAEAIAAVPDDYLEQTALLGSAARIRARWNAGYVPPGVTGVIVDAPQPEALELMADLAGTRAMAP
ncbi:LLM class F420-dependent oxidoreductase [Frankia sp. AgB1.9]|uniref:LLM class F420-dependent oxidoreductase n=1 Tax=unclassified Frankia TaxID=2632575 RepID=UPI0019318BF6|nr:MULTISPECIES: LLM class F420-dependent oxidoreductase [unclassified Frankia]MBL7487710.1 LLM class F420-dependent oxidoreductase [Frankia sp. AgW1.1]MBL7548047.1 LLM class F420-dependent oxidoreductase [Frankia sp. AgB1.9]MBL7624123.1 LLM class F420-dependent oxidoreductase [Frankia sp. AgB1.8]